MKCPVDFHIRSRDDGDGTRRDGCRNEVLAIDPRAFERARRAICAAVQGEGLKAHFEKLKMLDAYVPQNPAALRETIVQAVEEKTGYPL